MNDQLHPGDESVSVYGGARGGGGKPQPGSILFVLDGVAAAARKTTVLQALSNGGFVVYVTPNEADPMRALLSAAVSIMVKRGGPDAKGITVRKVLGVAAPGAEYFWQVTEHDDTVVASGYAATEADAAARIAEHIKFR